MQAILTNNTTKFARYYDDIQPNPINPMYLSFTIDTSKLQDGEYNLRVYEDNNELVLEDFVKVGEYTNNKIEYKVEKKFTQYVRK